MSKKPFTIPYVATLSPILRKCHSVYIQDQIEAVAVPSALDLWEQIESVIAEIHEKKEVADSIRTKIPGSKVFRQIDIKEGSRPLPGQPPALIVMKTFLTWNHDKNRWHIFVEGSEENYWENYFHDNRNS